MQNHLGNAKRGMHRSVVRSMWSRQWPITAVCVIRPVSGLRKQDVKDKTFAPHSIAYQWEARHKTMLPLCSLGMGKQERVCGRERACERGARRRAKGGD